VKAAAARWLAQYVPTARQPKGQAMTRARLTRYIEPALGHLLLRRLTKDHVRAFRVWLDGLPIAPTTVMHILSDVRCLLLWSTDAGLLDASPFPRRIMPRVQERPPDRLTDAEAETLRRLPDPYGFVCRLALGTGLRWGELTRAMASDVERGFLVVHQTKSGKVRRVPLEPDLLREVRNHVGRLVPFARCSPGTFARIVRDKSGVGGFHAHQMRHTFACQWLERGGSLAALQQILGHASIETTQRYARLTDEVVMRESRRLAGAARSQVVATDVATHS
jgi:integrase